MIGVQPPVGVQPPSPLLELASWPVWLKPTTWGGGEVQPSLGADQNFGPNNKALCSVIKGGGVDLEVEFEGNFELMIEVEAEAPSPQG